MTDNQIRTIAFVSLGCPKNLVDSERMLGLLANDGLTVTADAEDADAIVINTCGFLEASKVESLEEIHRAIELKEHGKCRRVVVAGCLVQRHKTAAAGRGAGNRSAGGCVRSGTHRRGGDGAMAIAGTRWTFSG